MRSTLKYAVVGMAVLTLACDARRDEANNNTNNMGNDPSIGTFGANNDQQFVERSMQSSMLEIELARLAQQKASSPEVKRFAEMMIRDHSKAGEELKQVAQQHSITATAQLDNEHNDLIQRLSQLNGAEFDREYMNAMVESHQDVVDHLESRANDNRDSGMTGTTGNQNQNAANQGVSQWASKTLPTTQHHLNEARRIEESLGNRMTQENRR